MVDAIKLAGREIGPGRPCFIIAEAGVNHNGSLETALGLVDAAARAGAHAVKFQSFNADVLVTRDAPKAAYQERALPGGGSQYDMLKALELSRETHERLLAHCEKQGILFLSSPFDEDSADMLSALGAPAFKIGSAEITNLPFLEYVARKDRPMLISTGMSGLGEVEAAVRAVEDTGNRDIVLLHCVSNYPAEPADVNLRAMVSMGAAFGLPVGYSDHALGLEISFAAVALGACVIEKHFTLDRAMPGPDHQSSIEPEEFAALAAGIRKVEAALGDGRKRAAASEADTALAARKSLVAAVDIPAGTVLDERMIAIKRPGTGLAPALRQYLIGRTARRAITAGTVLGLEMFS